MKANKDKCHLIVSDNEHVSRKIHFLKIENSDCQKLLGRKRDPKLNFKDHLNGVIKKVSRKVDVFSCITLYKNIAKWRLLINLFFTSQFTRLNYCPLIFMFHCHGLNNKINRAWIVHYILCIVTIDHSLKTCNIRIKVFQFV